MVRTDILRGVIASKNMTTGQVASQMGMSKWHLEKKLTHGQFGSEEMQALVEVLDLRYPERIFFAESVSEDFEEVSLA